MKHDAIVLLSGGQDSATCLAKALQEHSSILSICFDYGQRHKVEITQAKKLADMSGSEFLLLDMSFLKNYTSNALTQSDQAIVHTENDLPSTFVPGRNAMFLNAAAIIAYERGINTIFTGVCQTDYSGYPDCRETFIASMNQSLNLAMDTSFKIKTPLMHLTKSETVLLMHSLGKLDWYADTHTCYEGDRPACGECPSCKLRLKGFKEANIEDPLAYKSTTYS